ncbi:iron-containing alcohol dehydrogenase [Shewanella halifaxensis HAW-EB4]|uniref:Iron-containing alcohol dehydrogenase n=1 Tax=Shewanella halifaxensis (strain HAW-EB4) TaxID=458817 RepID=B0TJ10_SHEHH|nr:iron-containing alcohol dehydrogenase [Shewanella halifaxensis]ABZ78413.1 iron-containing alcohol dehydrogenase [Shewanella halifaxensis HAW-EB4]
MELQANWHFPTAITVGDGCLNLLGERCKALQMTKVLLVSDPCLATMPMVSEAMQYCTLAGLSVELFCDIRTNPTDEDVLAGVQVFNQGRFDGVVALGGGSSIDAAKAIAMIAKQSISLWEAEDCGNNWTRIDASLIIPVVAVPTTAGTGSEVGRAAVITDTKGAHAIKRIIFHPQMLPASVLLDPRLTTGLPANMTAATGFDALSHNLEAYCAPSYHPMAEGIALEGIRLIQTYLPLAVAKGDDIEARTQMLVASTMGATSFQRGLGGMHAIAHTLGALYNQHHGLLNAILMPYVLQRNRHAIEARIIRLARYLALEDSSFDGFLNWILQLREQLVIPHSLAEIGLDLRDKRLIGEMSAKDAAAKGNPIALTQAQYSQLFEQAVLGELN